MISMMGVFVLGMITTVILQMLLRLMGNLYLRGLERKRQYVIEQIVEAVEVSQRQAIDDTIQQLENHANDDQNEDLY